MNILCTGQSCPVFLSSNCVFYEGDTLVYSGIVDGDTLTTALIKIDAALGVTPVGGVWGSITGFLLDQTDLINYLANTYVPLTRNITINGVTYDLSQDRSWSLSSGHIIENSGTPVTQRNNLNFTNGLTASDDGSVTVVKLGGQLVETTTINGLTLNLGTPYTNDLYSLGMSLDSTVDNDWDIGKSVLIHGTNYKGSVYIDSTHVEIGGGAANEANAYFGGGSTEGTGIHLSSSGGVGKPIVLQTGTTAGNNVKFYVNNSTNGTIFADDRAVKTGIEYGGNYHVTYTLRSLVDKEYVDLLFSTFVGYTNLTQFVDQTPWRVFYSNGSGDVTELVLGSLGTYLQSNGPSAVPSWVSLFSGHVIENNGTPLTQRPNLNFRNGLNAEDGTPDSIIKLGGWLTENTNILGAFSFSIGSAVPVSSYELYSGVSSYNGYQLAGDSGSDPYHDIGVFSSGVYTGLQMRNRKINVLLGAFNEAMSNNIISASLTEIGSIEGNSVRITGTNTITALGTAEAGAHRTVIFDASLTLTHNATTLILPTGANIVTEAGDTAIFLSRGSGSWTCISYQRASGSALVFGSGYTNLTQFVDQTPWRVFYSNTNGDVTELALGTAGSYLQSNGASSAPTWVTPAGAGDMLLGTIQTVTAAKNFNDDTLGIWNPAGTFKYTFSSSAITSDSVISLPLLAGNDIMVVAATAQTLTNKTIELANNTITGTKDNFNAAAIDGNFLWEGDAWMLSNGGNLSGDNTISGSGTYKIGFTGTQIGIGLAPASIAIGARLDISGVSTGSFPTLRLADSGNTERFVFTDAGRFYVKTLPFTDDALDQILVRDGSTGEIKIRTVTSLTGGDMYLAQVQTVTGAKTFNDDILGVWNPAGTFRYIFSSSAITANRSVALPLLTAGDTFVFNNNIATLSNKTLTSPVINTQISGTVTSAVITTTNQLAGQGQANTYGDFDQVFRDNSIKIFNPTDTFQYTLTAGAITGNRALNLPVITGTDTIVVETLAQTLSNKTLISPIINTQVTTASTSIDLWNTVATTVNFAGAATALTLGAPTGVMNLRNATINLTAVPATDAGFATSNILVRDASGNVDKLAVSGGGTTNFLRADGTWAAPPSGGGTIGGSIANTQVAFGSAVNTITGSANFTYSSGSSILTILGTGSLKSTIYGNNGVEVQGTVTQRSTLQSAGITATEQFVLTAATGISLNATAGGVKLTTALLNDDALTQVLVRAVDGTIKYRTAASLAGGGGGLTDGDKGDITITGTGTVFTVDADISKTWVGTHVFTTNQVVISLENATTNTQLYPLKIRRTSTATPALGIGVGIEFETETSVGNNEIGSVIKSYTTDVATLGNEDFAMQLLNLTNGTSLEGISIGSASGLVTVNTIAAAANHGLSLRSKGTGTASILGSNGGFSAESNASYINAVYTNSYTLGMNSSYNGNYGMVTVTGTPSTVFKAFSVAANTTSPLVGFGASLDFRISTGLLNVEAGAVIEAESTVLTANSESFDLVMKTMSAGAIAAERFRINNLKLESTVPVRVPSFTVAGVPSASSIAGAMIYVTNEVGGAVIAFSDGTNWRRVTDRAIIS